MLLQEFRMINSPTFPLLILYCVHKIKLKLIHSDKRVLEILMKMKTTLVQNIHLTLSLIHI